jgi:Lrp/AsnC family transcriptional regulator, leucine-responsive regulatory protein
MKNKRTRSFESKEKPGADSLKVNLDSADHAILEIVQREGRASFAHIGQQVGLTPPSVAGRMQRLEDAGIIAGYHAEVVPSRVGFALTAFLLARAVTSDARVTEAVQSRPEIIECYRVTGEVSFVIRAVLSGVEHLEDLIDYLEQHAYVTTLIVLSTALKRPGVAFGETRETNRRSAVNRRRS